MKNEIKVGILGISMTVLLFWGYNFLKGKNVFSSATILKAEFQSVIGLNIASPILINGFKVGAVTKIYQSERFDGTIIAELSIEAKVNLPKNTKAVIITPSLMSGNAISLEFTGSCQEDTDCLKSGDTIEGVMGGMTMVQDALAVVKPYLDKLDTLSGSLKNVMDDPDSEIQRSVKDVQATLHNVKNITDLLNNLLVSTSLNLASTTANVKSITDNVKGSNDEISAVIENLKEITEKMKQLDLTATTQEAKQVFTGLNQTLDQAQQTLKKTNQAMDNVVTATKFQEQEGLVAALLYDKVLKEDLKMTVKDMDLLLKDIRLHPERYRTVLSGKKKPYVSPEEEEAKRQKKKR